MDLKIGEEVVFVVHIHDPFHLGMPFWGSDKKQITIDENFL